MNPDNLLELNFKADGLFFKKGHKNFIQDEFAKYNENNLTNDEVKSLENYISKKNINLTNNHTVDNKDIAKICLGLFFVKKGTNDKCYKKETVNFKDLYRYISSEFLSNFDSLESLEESLKSYNQGRSKDNLDLKHRGPAVEIIKQQLIEKIQELKKYKLAPELNRFCLDTTLRSYCYEFSSYQKLLTKNENLDNYLNLDDFRIFNSEIDGKFTLLEKLTDINIELNKFSKNYQNIFEKAAKITLDQIKYYDKYRLLPYYLQEPFMGDIEINGKKINETLSCKQGEAVKIINDALKKEEKEYKNIFGKKRSYSSKAYIRLESGQGKTFLIEKLKQNLDQSIDLLNFDLNSSNEELSDLLNYESNKKILVILDEEFFYSKKFKDFLIANKDRIIDKQYDSFITDDANNLATLHEMFVWKLRETNKTVVMSSASESLEKLKDEFSNKDNKIAQLEKLKKANKEEFLSKAQQSNIIDSLKEDLKYLINELPTKFAGDVGVSSFLTNNDNKIILKNTLHILAFDLAKSKQYEFVKKEIGEKYKETITKIREYCKNDSATITKLDLLGDIRLFLEKWDKSINYYESLDKKSNLESILSFAQNDDKISRNDSNLKLKKQQLLKNITYLEINKDYILEKIKKSELSNLQIDLDGNFLEKLIESQKSNIDSQVNSVAQFILPDLNIKNEFDDDNHSLVVDQSTAIKLKKKFPDYKIIIPFNDKNNQSGFYLINFSDNSQNINVKTLTKQNLTKFLSEERNIEGKILTFFDKSNVIDGDYRDLSLNVKNQIWVFGDYKDKDFHLLQQFHDRDRSPFKNHQISIIIQGDEVISKESLIEKLEENTKKIDQLRLHAKRFAQKLIKDIDYQPSNFVENIKNENNSTSSENESIEKFEKLNNATILVDFVMPRADQATNSRILDQLEDRFYELNSINQESPVLLSPMVDSEVETVLSQTSEIYEEAGKDLVEENINSKYHILKPQSLDKELANNNQSHLMSAKTNSDLKEDKTTFANEFSIANDVDQNQINQNKEFDGLWKFYPTSSITIGLVQYERLLYDTKIEERPTNLTQVTSSQNILENINNIWLENGDDRKNKFRIIAQALPKNIGEYERQEKIKELFIDIIAYNAVKLSLDYEDTLKIVKHAKQFGGIANNLTEQNDYQKYTNLDPQDKSLFTKFSSECQDQALKCGIYSGRDSENSDHGLRLTFFNLDKIGLLKEKMDNIKQTQRNIYQIRSNISKSLQDQGRV